MKIEQVKHHMAWADGLCNKCGSIVIEMSANCIVNDALGNDYQNMCSNPLCEEHKWHYCGDIEQLDYYKHKG